MSIEELLHAVPPPEHPLDTGTVDRWSEVEDSIGLQFPSDLYELCVRYGSGWFGPICIHNPFAEGYRAAIAQVLDIFRVQKEDLGEDAVPYPLYPDRPGLFPVGFEDNGGVICFLTEGHSDNWPIILWEKRAKWERLEMSTSTFLARTVTKEVECSWWDPEWLEEYGPELNQFRPRQES